MTFGGKRQGLPFANLLASISSRPQGSCISVLEEIFTSGNTLNLPLHPNQRRLAHTPGKGWTHHGGRLYRRREGGDLECFGHTASPPPPGGGRLENRGRVLKLMTLGQEVGQLFSSKTPRWSRTLTKVAEWRGGCRTLELVIHLDTGIPLNHLVAHRLHTF